MKPEVILTCALATCGRRFIPTSAQLGQRKRRRKLYCSPECCEAARREKSRAWWRSPAGLRYARQRRKAQKEKAAS